MTRKSRKVRGEKKAAKPATPPAAPGATKPCARLLRSRNGSPQPCGPGLVSRQSLGLAPKLPILAVGAGGAALDCYGGRIPWGATSRYRRQGDASLEESAEESARQSRAGGHRTEGYVEAVKGNERPAPRAFT